MRLPIIILALFCCLPAIGQGQEGKRKPGKPSDYQRVQAREAIKHGEEYERERRELVAKRQERQREATRRASQSSSPTSSRAIIRRGAERMERSQ